MLRLILLNLWQWGLVLVLFCKLKGCFGCLEVKPAVVRQAQQEQLEFCQEMWTNRLFQSYFRISSPSWVGSKDWPLVALLLAATCGCLMCDPGSAQVGWDWRRVSLQHLSWPWVISIHMEQPSWAQFTLLLAGWFFFLLYQPIQDVFKDTHKGRRSAGKATWGEDSKDYRLSCWAWQKETWW